MNERQPTTSERDTVRETTPDDVESTRASDVREQRSPTASRTTVSDNTADTASAAGAADREAGFLPEQRMESMRERWNDVQAAFVDDPRSAVQQAHQLVTQLVNELTDVFTRERSTLEGQWSGGGQPDTETLRVALQRYRVFFNRLLDT